MKRIIGSLSLIATLAACACLTSCQNGKLTITPQEQAAGVAALASVTSDLAAGKKPAQTAIDAATAALAAAAATPAAP